MGLVGDNVSSLDVDTKGEIPHLIVAVARFIRWNKNSGRNDNRVDATISKHYILEQFSDRFAIRHIAAEADGGAAIRYARTRNANPRSILVYDLVSRGLCRSFVFINAYDMSAFLT